MQAGLPSSSPAGSPNWFILDSELTDYGDGTGAKLKLRPSEEGANKYWAIVVDGIVQSVVYLRANQDLTVPVAYDPNRTTHVVSPVCQGQWPTKVTLNVMFQQESFEADKGASIQVDWDAVIEELEAYGDDGQLSNFALTGLRRWNNVRQTGDMRTRGRLSIRLTTDAGTHTLDLLLEDRVVATGSRVGDGSIDLVESDGSGVSGSVDLAHTADIDLEDGAFLMVRWAGSYEVHLDDVLQATVLDDGVANHFAYALNDVEAGAREVKVRAITDTGVSGSLSSAIPITVPGRPEPPGDVSYLSGDWTNTVIRFAESETPGVSYVYYDSELDRPVDTNPAVAPVSENISGGFVEAQLPSLASGGTGKRRVMVEAESGGVESGYRKRVVIEYAAGVRVAPRPNIPGFSFNAVSGRTLTVNYAYNSAGQKGVATEVQIDLVAEGGSLGSPHATASAALAGSAPIYSGTVNVAATADGYYLFVVRAKTAAGTLSENVFLFGPVWLATATPAIPANVAAKVVT